MKTKNQRSRSVRITSRKRRMPASIATIDLVPAVMKLKSILVPLDFSDTSGKALDYAIAYSRQFGAKLTLLYVIEPVATPDFATFPLMMDNDQASRSARTRMQALCEQRHVRAAELNNLVVRQGRAFHEICEAARTLKSDLIVIGTHGYTGLKHAVLGSTAERVVRHAPCPVLVVRQRERQFA